MRSEHKVTGKKPKVKKKQDEMQEIIVKTEWETKEVVEKGEISPSFREMMDKNSKTAVQPTVNKICEQ